MNDSESRRIQFTASSRPAAQVLTHLYFLLEVETKWFKSEMEGLASQSHRALDRRTTERAAGFCFFAALLGRPPTRACVWRPLSTAHFLDKLLGEQVTTLYVTDHKSMATYGTLVASFPAWCAQILTLYSRQIRPALLRDGKWGKANSTNFFPQEIFNYLKQFLEDSAGIGHITARAIRSMFTLAVGQIASNSAWFRFKDELGIVAAHQIKASKTLEVSTSPLFRSFFFFISQSQIPGFLRVV